MIEKLGTKERTTIYHSLDEVPEEERQHIIDAHKRGRKVRGWYENGQIYLFLPDIDSEYQAEKTIWHETVAHHGLRELIGAENLDKLLKQLWLEHRDGEMGMWVTERMQKNGWKLNEAIEEYLAREAEKNPFKEPGLWQRLRWMLADILHKMGFATDPTIADVLVFASRLVADSQVFDDARAHVAQSDVALRPLVVDGHLSRLCDTGITILAQRHTDVKKVQFRLR